MVPQMLHSDDDLHPNMNPDMVCAGQQLKVLTDAVENYHAVLGENRRLYNEVQELKGFKLFVQYGGFVTGLRCGSDH